MTDFDVNAISDDWESLADAGRAIAAGMDTDRFALGDLALRVEGRYGTDAIGQFASDIGMARKSTLKEYRRVSARYEPAIRMAYSEALSWSHFQAACAAKDDAELWLARAADEGWPVAALARAIKEATGLPVPPKLLWSGEARIVTDGERGWFIELPRDGVEWHTIRRATVKVYEVNADA